MLVLEFNIDEKRDTIFLIDFIKYSQIIDFLMLHF